MIKLWLCFKMVNQKSKHNKAVQDSNEDNVIRLLNQIASVPEEVHAKNLQKSQKNIFVSAKKDIMGIYVQSLRVIMIIHKVLFQMLSHKQP